MYQQFGLKCSNCGDEIYSNSRHDWEQCRCGGTFIDGGWDYQRWGGEHGGTATRISRMVDKKGTYYYGDEPLRKALP